MKPEFKIKGQEASAADYAALMQALLASQATTPTARACANGSARPQRPSPLETLLGPAAIAAKDGEQAVYPRISGFLEAGDSNGTASGQPATGPAARFD